jgi:capsid protein
MLQETTVASQALQAAYAITLESQLPPAQALGGLVVSEDGYDPLAAREKWYQATGGVKINPGTVNVLSPGDSLKMNRPNGLSGDYGEFNSALIREASRAAGALVEAISGDFSKTSFSASRLAVELPYRITLRRRKMIVERFYRAIFEAWLEEQIERSLIQLPPGAKPFQQARSAYTNAVWLGSGRVEADRKKAAEATALELSMGLTTFAEACSDRGLSFEAILEQRVQEQKALEASGSLGKSIFPAGRVTTQINDQDGVESEPKDAEGKDKEFTNDD